MISRLLIANRGEIARRIMATARRLDVECVAVFSDADAHAAHTREADTAVRIGPAAAAESYLRGDAILDAALATGADAIHPGYGFLSENAEFARAVEAAGLIFVGPSASAIEAMGRKDAAKALMSGAGVPVTPGYHGADQSDDVLAQAARETGYPVLIKAVSGGGGKGMRRVETPAEFANALASARREAAASFGDDRVLIEKFVTQPRHIEVQIFADTHGGVVHLFERDCSLQRRHQKVIEEAPAPGMTKAVRARLTEAAVAAARAVDYRNAGTVEFIADGSKGLKADSVYFMEMNTRLQVEHPVTELVTGVDLVEWQLRVASGQALPGQDEIALRGHAIEARVYAEDPLSGFLPATGEAQVFQFDGFDTDPIIGPQIEGGEDGAPILRLDSALEEGDEVSPHYDPMAAKAIAFADTRAAACAGLSDALAQAQVAPLKTNLGFLVQALRHPEFVAARFDTGFIDAHLDALIATPDETAFASAAGAVEALICEITAQDLQDAQDAQQITDPWQVPDGFRLNAAPQVWSAFAGADGVIAVESRISAHGLDQTIGETHVALSGLSLEGASDLSRGRLSWRAGDRQVSAGFARLDDDMVVFIDGHARRLSAPQAAAAGSLEAGDDIVAPMPGRVVMVHASQGDVVARGDVIAVLEAMKMEHALTAPRDGVIGQVLVAANAQVVEGALMARMEPLVASTGAAEPGA